MPYLLCLPSTLLTAFILGCISGTFDCVSSLDEYGERQGPRYHDSSFDIDDGVGWSSCSGKRFASRNSYGDAPFRNRYFYDGEHFLGQTYVRSYGGSDDYRVLSLLDMSCLFRFWTTRLGVFNLKTPRVVCSDTGAEKNNGKKVSSPSNDLQGFLLKDGRLCPYPPIVYWPSHFDWFL